MIIEGDCVQKYDDLSYSSMIGWNKVHLTLMKLNWQETRFCERTANKVADMLSKLRETKANTFPANTHVVTQGRYDLSQYAMCLSFAVNVLMLPHLLFE